MNGILLNSNIFVDRCTWKSIDIITVRIYFRSFIKHKTSFTDISGEHANECNMIDKCLRTLWYC